MLPEALWSWCTICQTSCCAHDWPSEPSEFAIHENAYGWARYAVIVTENGLVPIVKLEILVDRPHDINKYAEVIKHVLAAYYKALKDHHDLLEGAPLKPNVNPWVKFSKGPS